MGKTYKPEPVLFILLVIFTMFLWGVAWPLGKMISLMATSSVIVFWRFVLAFIVMIPLLIFFKLSILINIKYFLLVFITGALMAGYNHLFFTGLSIGLAGAGGVLVTTTSPMFTYILSLIFLKEKISIRATIALVIGVCGGLIILNVWDFNQSELFASGNITFLIGSITWALLTILSQGLLDKIHFVVFSFYNYLFSAVIYFFICLPYAPFSVFTLGSRFWIILLYLALLSTGIGSTVYFMATKKIGSHKASSFTFLVPVTALAASFFLLKEIPSLYTITGGIMAMAAVYLINKSNKKS